MAYLHHKLGNVLEPIIKPAMIIHCCNDVGGFGKGFVTALAEKYPESKRMYQNWYNTGTMKLGDVQFVQVEPDVCIANMIGQHGVRWQGKIPPIRYDALESCLKKVYDKALKENYTVFGPRFGCVLAGGKWPLIEELILKHITVETYIYTLPKQQYLWPTEYENL